MQPYMDKTKKNCAYQHCRYGLISRKQTTQKNASKHTFFYHEPYKYRANPKPYIVVPIPICVKQGRERKTNKSIKNKNDAGRKGKSM